MKPPSPLNSQQSLLNQLKQIKSIAEFELKQIQEREEFRQALDCPPLMAEKMGYTLVDKVHYEIWERIKNRKKPHVLLLFHRHGIKSTIFNYIDNVCRLIKNPKLKGLIYSSTHLIAKSQLEATKQLLEHKYLKNFGINLKGNVWTKEYIRIVGSEFAPADNTYTLETGGVDKTLTAKHYDFIKIDDVQNEVNSKFNLDRENVIEKFRGLFNLQKRDDKTNACEIFVIGTRYHPKDVYQVIIDEMSDIFELIIIPDTRIINGVEVPTLPKVFPTLQHLEIVKKELGEYGYFCQFKQNPHIKFSTCLDWNKISVISDEELNKIFNDIKNNKIQQQNIALILDPASEIEKGSNYSALAFVYYDGTNLNILRIWKIKGLIDDIVNLAISIIREFGVQYFYCEKSGLESNIKFYLNKKLSEIGMSNYVIVEPLSHKIEAKNSRILALQPLINDGKVRRANKFMFQTKTDEPPVDMFSELEKEIRTFPNSGMDDMLDTIAYSLRKEVFDIAANFFMPEFAGKEKIDKNIQQENIYEQTSYVEFI